MGLVASVVNRWCGLWYIGEGGGRGATRTSGGYRDGGLWYPWGCILRVLRPAVGVWCVVVYIVGGYGGWWGFLRFLAICSWGRRWGATGDGWGRGSQGGWKVGWSFLLGSFSWELFGGDVVVVGEGVHNNALWLLDVWTTVFKDGVGCCFFGWLATYIVGFGCHFTCTLCRGGASFFGSGVDFNGIWRFVRICVGG